MNAVHIKNGSRYEQNGWIRMSLKGNAKDRGYAHGFLVSKDLTRIFAMIDFNMVYIYGYTREFFSDVISAMFKPQILENFPEYYDEMESIAKGAKDGGANVSLDDIVMWNCYSSIEYVLGTMESFILRSPFLSKKYANMFSSENSSNTDIRQGVNQGGGRSGKGDHCTAFMAVGEYTRDGKIVCAHNSFDNFIDGQNFNIMMDITASETNSNSFLMQTAAGCISSCTDYYITSNGFICTETTICGFSKFVLKDPICCRIRKAVQYSTTLDDFVKFLTKNNGGDYANSWLIGDTRNNTIMRIELGLMYVNVEKKTNGYFIGYNAPEDPRIRNIECVNTGYEDIRRHQGARRVRLTELMKEYKGKLDLVVAKKIISDHYDVYLNKTNPCSRTCCSHYELDDRAFMSQADRPKPYQPRGALDGIVCDTNMAKKMSIIARWGTSCGTSFNKKKFFENHTQWSDQEPYVLDRPTQPWTIFSINKKRGQTKKNRKVV
jgi:hypothetical protein